MRAIILLSAALAVIHMSAAQAATYHRFWRGMKLDQLSTAQFQKALNTTFVPKTIQTGMGNGLIGYEPVLTLGERGLPDEIALVSYEDQASYAALVATPAGKAYVALHWTLFAQDESGSTVPEPYQGAVALEHAYDLHPEYAGWQQGTTLVRVGFRKLGEGDSSYLERFKTELEAPSPAGLEDRVAIVSNAYWLDYVSVTSARAARIAAAGAELVFPLASGAVGSVSLAPGRGVNLRFQP